MPDQSPQETRGRRHSDPPEIAAELAALDAAIAAELPEAPASDRWPGAIMAPEAPRSALDLSRSLGLGCRGAR